MKKLLALILALLMTTLVFASCNTGGEEISKREAEDIANAFVTEMFGNEYHDFSIETEEREELWIVEYSEETSELVLDGGGPRLVIRKDSGEILSCMVGTREYVLWTPDND